MKTLLRAGAVFSLACLSAHAQVGTELKELEKKAADPAKIAPKDAAPAAVPEVKPPASSPAPVRTGATGAIPAGGLTRVGDIELLAKSSTHTALVGKHATGPLSIDDLDQAAQKIQAELVSAGYFLARVTVEETDAGKAKLAVDGGRVGQVGVFKTPRPYKELNPAQRKDQRKPYSGHFSSGQVQDRVPSVKPGSIFNYNEMHANLVDANSSPDLAINSDLLLRTEAQAEGDIKSRRFMDINLYVEDNLPVHGAVEYKNTGTAGTEPERLIFTLQHLNLTKNDDALTFNVPLSAPDLGVLHAFSSTYILPFKAGKGGGLSVLGGWSELDAPAVADGVSVDADGWFAGGRVFTRLVNSPDHLFNIAAGAVYRSIDEVVDFTSLSLTDNGGYEVLPLTLSLVYSSNQPDALRGRNYLTAMSSYNVGDAAGITDEEEVAAQTPGAKTDYLVHRLEATRIQSLFGTFVPRSGTYDGEWYFLISAEAQYSSDPLLSVEQMVMGGFETVRGYPERDAVGDRGYGGKLELRTPVMRGPYTKWFVDRRDIEESRKQPVDYVQFNVFLDAAHVERLDSGDEPGVDTDLLGVGAGVRLSLTQYTQAKFDYGWPLEDTETSDDNGRFHFSVQGQF